MKMILMAQGEAKCPLCKNGYIDIFDYEWRGRSGEYVGIYSGIKRCTQCKGTGKITKPKHYVFVDNNKKTEMEFPLPFSSELVNMCLKKLRTSPVLNLLKE